MGRSTQSHLFAAVDPAPLFHGWIGGEGKKEGGGWRVEWRGKKTRLDARHPVRRGKRKKRND